MGKTQFGIIYANLGEVDRPDIERRKVAKAGFVTSPGLAMKMYSMLKISPEDSSMRIQRARGFIEQEAYAGRINPLSGLGFIIFSEDAVNVARWDKQNPLVIVNQVYDKDCKLLDIREAGSFCVYELVIVTHERSAWERFLRSRRETEDKKEYLNSWFEGEIK